MGKSSNYNYTALLAEVAKAVGWEHWHTPAGGPLLPPSFPVWPLSDDVFWDGEFWHRNLNAIAALEAKAGIGRVEIENDGGRFLKDEFQIEASCYIPKTGGYYELPPQPDGNANADTEAHARLLALAKAVGIDVEKFKEEAQ
jgi:hypothetical protein